jgi:hypothetical protein
MVEMPEAFDELDSDMKTLRDKFATIDIEMIDDDPFSDVFSIKTPPYANRDLVYTIQEQTDFTIHNLETDDNLIEIHVIA